MAATQEEYNAALAVGDISSFSIAEHRRINKLVPYNWGQEAAVANARKYRDMGYTVSIQTPELKDFNADLLVRHNSYRQHSQEPEIEREVESDKRELEMDI